MEDLEPFISKRSYEIMKNVILKSSQDEIKDVYEDCEKVLMTFQNGEEKHHAGCIYNFSLTISLLSRVNCVFKLTELSL